MQLTNAHGVLVHDLCDGYDAEPRFLGGLDYPAGKEDLIKRAEQEGETSNSV